MSVASWQGTVTLHYNQDLSHFFAFRKSFPIVHGETATMLENDKAPEFGQRHLSEILKS